MTEPQDSATADARPFIPVRIAVMTVSDTRTFETDRSGQVISVRIGCGGSSAGAGGAGYIAGGAAGSASSAGGAGGGATTTGGAAARVCDRDGGGGAFGLN